MKRSCIMLALAIVICSFSPSFASPEAALIVPQIGVQAKTFHSTRTADFDKEINDWLERHPLAKIERIVPSLSVRGQQHDEHFGLTIFFVEDPERK